MPTEGLIDILWAHLRAKRYGGQPSRYHGRAKVGGSAWESNPASPRKRGATDFEDREGRRAPFTSVGSQCNCGLLLSENRLHDRPGITQILEHDVRSGRAQLIDAVIAGGDCDQSRAAGLRARHVERRVADDDGV